MLGLVALFLSLAGAAWPQARLPHSSPMAGRWFPAERAALEQALDNYYAAASRRAGEAPPRKGLLALVAPHAGFDYSGVVAASAYRLLDRPARVILLGFSHRGAVNGVVAPNVDAYSTPLGELKVDRAARASLGFPLADEKPLCDHSLENQLAFVQRAAPGVPFVPLYVGALDGEGLRAAARKLAARVKKGDVLVASSDFTHYGQAYGYVPFPNDDKLPARLRERAMEAFEHVGSLDTGLFDKFLRDTGDTICGRDPIRLLMASLAEVDRDGIFMQTADAMSSSEKTGDHSLSVGYGALAFYRTSSFEAGDDDRGLLLKHARATLDAKLRGADAPQFSGKRSAAMCQRSGSFVTIRKGGELRGCIGALSPATPLPETIADRTIAAAASDPRFPPLSPGEGPVGLELSLLTPLRRLASWKDFREGFGAVLVSGSRGGLLLPQVAAEMGWTPKQFLEGLSRKAGLPPDAYRSPNARIYVFAAQVFGEPASVARRQPAVANGSHSEGLAAR